MISTQISRVSAILLLIGGLTFLFAPDVILPRLIPSFPVSGEWIGQMLAGSWLSLGALNWLSRPHMIGGIYNRSTVMANAVFYFVAATVLIKRTGNPETPAVLWLLVVPISILAVVYMWLLFRGPFQRDLEKFGKA